MKPGIAQLCLDHLHEYAIQFKKPEMVALDGTIQTFNGMLCDLAPEEVCDWEGHHAVACKGTFCLTTVIPFPVTKWCGLETNWCPGDKGIHTKHQLVAWLKREAKGEKS